MNKNVLTVRNVEQAAAWLELDGQLSDGKWENARPLDHWKPWTNAVVKIAAPGERLGRNFFASKDNYNFTDSELLQVVGARMLGIVRIARRLGLPAAQLFEFNVSDSLAIDWTRVNSEKRATMAELGISEEDVNVALRMEDYDMRRLRADLKDLKTIVRTTSYSF